MKTSDVEFEYNERAEGYIYVNEDRLEEEIKKIISSKKNVEALKIPEEISRDAYLCLTKKRENILKWYPLAENASVLEVGAGYGELTAYLCEHVNQVACYERKTERINVIKMRCAAYKNLTCYSGHLQEQQWMETFDYIFIHDIFALSRKFFKGTDASVEMLRFLLPYLKADGRLLLTIENRLGLKYFAGAAEEISTQLFWGLKSFEEDERCRTFSKKELEEILRESGFTYVNWFYPYPGLVYPMEIYTDEIMDKIVYGISRPDYELVSDRYQFFDEQRMFWTLHKEGIADRFVNAFFVECARKAIEKPVLFSEIDRGFVIHKKTEQGYVDSEGRLLPEGIRLDAYLSEMIQYAVNCNLGSRNPYIPQIYNIFRDIYCYMQRGAYALEDFYYSKNGVTPHQGKEYNGPASEYQRWKVMYEWYVNHIMFYRNAKRRILLEDLNKIMDIQEENIAAYLANWREQRDKHYIVPRYSQNMFDFEAEAAKDILYFDKGDLCRHSLKERLEKLWNLEGLS